MSDLKDWFMSGQAAVIDGLTLRPQPYAPGSHIVFKIAKGQADVYYLRDDGQGEWMLKKFRPGRAPDAANIVSVQSSCRGRAGSRQRSSAAASGDPWCRVRDSRLRNSSTGSAAHCSCRGSLPRTGAKSS